MKYVLGICTVLIVVIIFTWSAYQFKRTWNYAWGYQSRVEQTVCEMVKPEYLKNPEDCR